MGTNNWFRKKTWTEGDRKDFFDRLGRARQKFNQAQYLRIQALHLQRDAQPPLYEAALELLELFLKDYSDPAELPSALLQKAECLQALQKIPEAQKAFTLAIKAEKQKGAIQTTAPLDYGAFVVRHKLKENYEEVLKIFEKVDMLTLFSDTQWTYYSTLALIYKELGKPKIAKPFAEKALGAAQAMKGDGFSPDPSLSHLLKEIAEPS